MKPKKQKPIKRYSPFEDKRRNRRKTRIKIGVLLAGLALLFGAGWLLAGQIIGGGWSLPTFGGGQTTAPPASQSSEATPEPSETQPDPEPEDTWQTAPGTSYWASLTPQDISPATLDSTVQALAAQGVTHAVVTLKDEAGNLFYQSGEGAAEGSVLDAGFDARAVAAALSAAGIQPVARIYAMQDGLAPYNDRSMGVHLDGSDNYLWLNNAKDKGGVPWLNPFADAAADYISAILAEVQALGYTQSVVAGLQFPEGYSLERATYGTAADEAAKADRLAQLAQRWQNQLETTGGVCWFEYSAETLANGADFTAGATPIGFGVGHYVAVLESAAQPDVAALVEKATAAGTQLVLWAEGASSGWAQQQLAEGAAGVLLD